VVSEVTGGKGLYGNLKIKKSKENIICLIHIFKIQNSDNDSYYAEGIWVKDKNSYGCQE
jgi:hypothetical protein